MHPALAGKRAPRLSRLSVTVFGLLSAAGIATGGAGICPPGAGDRGPGTGRHAAGTNAITARPSWRPRTWSSASRHAGRRGMQLTS